MSDHTPDKTTPRVPAPAPAEYIVSPIYDCLFFLVPRRPPSV